MEIISKDCIALHASAKSWEEAISLAGGLLLKAETITEDYIEQMIQSVHEMGPYIVLTPGFALAHSAPSSAVKKTSLSLITLDKPVDFGGNKGPVDIVMSLACTSKDSHMAMIQQVAKLLLVPGMLDEIRKAKSVDELYLLINKE